MIRLVLKGINVHAALQYGHVSSFVMNLRLVPNVVCVNSDGSVEVAGIHRHAQAFTRSSKTS